MWVSLKEQLLLIEAFTRNGRIWDWMSVRLHGPWKFSVMDTNSSVWKHLLAGLKEEWNITI